MFILMLKISPLDKDVHINVHVQISSLDKDAHINVQQDPSLSSSSSSSSSSGNEHEPDVHVLINVQFYP